MNFVSYLLFCVLVSCHYSLCDRKHVFMFVRPSVCQSVCLYLSAVCTLLYLGLLTQVDMIAAPLTITAARHRSVDFVQPFSHIGLSVVIQKPSK